MVARLVFLRREGGGFFHFFLSFFLWRDLRCKDFISVCYLFLI